MTSSIEDIEGQAYHGSNKPVENIVHAQEGEGP